MNISAAEVIAFITLAMGIGALYFQTGRLVGTVNEKLDNLTDRVGTMAGHGERLAALEAVQDRSARR